jgi:hypothetical protein
MPLPQIYLRPLVGYHQYAKDNRQEFVLTRIPPEYLHSRIDLPKGEHANSQLERPHSRSGSGTSDNLLDGKANPGVSPADSEQAVARCERRRLDPTSDARWLDLGADANSLHALLLPYPGERMEAFAVNPW